VASIASGAGINELLAQVGASRASLIPVSALLIQDLALIAVTIIKQRRKK
jgi:hypothetical protein